MQKENMDYEFVLCAPPEIKLCEVNQEKSKNWLKKTQFYCEECNGGLCAVPCFKKYHYTTQLLELSNAEMHYSQKRATLFFVQF